MRQEEFLPAISELKARGKSIREIATELGVNRGRVDRALKKQALSATDKPAPQANKPPAADGTGREVFVGRRQEVGVLRTALADSLSGRGRIVMLVGEPGIGKTRTSQELAFVAEERGAQVLWGRCYEGQGAPPYWPWIQIARSYVQGRDADDLRSAMGTCAADIATIVPEVKEILPDLEPSPRSEPEQARFRLFDSITSFLKNASIDRPLVLLLDNLHWADRSSLLLLEFLSQELTDARILVIGTYRDEELSREHPLALTLGELTKHPHFQRIILRGLTQDDIRLLIELVSGDTPSEELAETIYRQTEGNPFFATEVVRMLAQEGTLTQEPVEGQEGLSLRVPEGVKEAIGRRLHTLSGLCNQAMTVASVVGREFELELMKRLIPELSEEQFLGVLEEALSAGIIEEMPDTVGRCQFAHVLIQETLSQEFSSARRARLHAKIGAMLEDVHGVMANEHADQLAYHYLRGDRPEKAVEFALKAGNRSSAVYAWEQALDHYEAALKLLERLETEPRQQAEVLERLSQVAAVGKGKDFLPYSERAILLYEILGDRKNAGAVHLEVSRLMGPVMGFGNADWEVAHSHALKAIETLEQEGDSPHLAGAYVQLGNVRLHLWGSVQESITKMEDGLAMAEHLDSASEVAFARAFLAHALVQHAGELRRGLDLHHKALEVARKGNDLVTFSKGAQSLSGAYMSLCDAHESTLWAEQGVEAADRSGAMYRLVTCNLHIAWASILLGDVPGALAGLERAQETARKVGVDVGRLPTLSSITPALVHFFLGDWERAEAEASERLEASRRSHTVTIMQAAALVLASMCMEEGDMASAKAYLLEIAQASEAASELALEVAPRALLAEVCSKSGEPEEAAAHLSRVLGILSNGEDWRALAAKVHLAEAVLATAEQRWEDADASFGKALEVNRRYDSRYYEAKCLMEWGQMRLSRHDPGNREQGLEMLGQAQDIFKDIQASKMVEKAAALRQSIGTQPLRAGVYPAGLTVRQAEVLRLIAEGKTNREIAKALVLSERTVQRHIADIYTKIGSRNRAEATAFALTNRLSLK